MEQPSNVVTLKLRPPHVRFARHYANYRSLRIGIVDSLRGALRLTLLPVPKSGR